MGGMSSVSESEFDSVCEIATEAGRQHDMATVVGSTATFQREAIRRAQLAESFGADGTMIAAPYGLPVTPEGAVAFFRDVAESLTGEMALMLYNYSPLNALNITPQMWLQLLEIPSVKAVKESNFALPHFDEVLLTVADKVNVFTGNDPAFMHASTLGAVGVTAIFSWCAPRLGVKFVDACRNGHQDDRWVRDAFGALQQMSAVIRRPDMPSMLSYEHGYLNAIVELAGGSGGAPRKPYLALPDVAVDELAKASATLRDMESGLT
jgi:dihydrodipicolinate synthase/N-acetylneuraminate lyase